MPEQHQASDTPRPFRYCIGWSSKGGAAGRISISLDRPIADDNDVCSVERSLRVQLDNPRLMVTSFSLYEDAR